MSAIAGVILAIVPADGRDREGRYAAQDPELHHWFDGLKSGKGPCCSDADGSALSDVDWKSPGQDGNRYYQVRIPDHRGEFQWIEVPNEAVITEPNRIGKTMVWPIRSYLGVTIRCFLPSNMM